jgi:hypothetical protein
MACSDKKKIKGGEIPTQRWRDSYSKVERFLPNVERFLHESTDLRSKKDNF